MMECEAFIKENASPTCSSFVPEITLYLADKMEALWKKIETITNDPDIPPPYWAFAWVGGQGLARYILDHPETVRGKRVLDFASGSGIVAIAAAKAGAKAVFACDIDPYAKAAIQINAGLNEVAIEQRPAVDFKQVPKNIDVILAGDVCYEHLMAHRSIAWLRLCKEAGVEVMLGDPGRAYAPKEAIRELSRYTVPASTELEDRGERDVSILTLC